MSDKIAIVLSGGGTSGAFQIGVLKALAKKIKPDFFVGTSIGALNACGISRKKNLIEGLIETEKNWNELSDKRENFFSFKRIPLPPFSLYKGDSLKEIIKNHFEEINLEDLHIKNYIGAINLLQGKVEFFNKGKLSDVLFASCSVPPFLPPYQYKNSLYIDAGIDTCSCIRKADKLGADKIIVIRGRNSNKKISSNPLLNAKKMFDIILEDHFDFICNGNLKNKVYTIKPGSNIPNPINSLKHTKEIIGAGEEAGKKFLNSNNNLL